MTIRQVTCVAIALTPLSLGACGGQVNLGETAGPAPAPVESEPVGPDAPVGKLVAQLTADIRVDLIAVAGDYLYVGNFEGLSRCRKSNCIPTLELVRGVGTNLVDVRVHGQSLGVVHADVGETWLASYSLPSGGGERVVLRGLPSSGASQAWWHGEFVYWGLTIDQSVYRCQLPSCGQGPEWVGSVNNLLSLQPDGDVVFWNDESFIYRSANFGAGPVEVLLADEGLSQAPIDSETGQPLPPPLRLRSLAIGAGALYAALDIFGCYQNCTSPIVRWPRNGSPREDIVTSSNKVTRISVVDQELVWIDAHPAGDINKESTLWSCLVDDCNATRRKLGYVTGYVAAATPVVVSDETDLYWLEAGPDPKYLAHSSSGLLTNIQIRRAPRLVPSTP